MREKVGDEESNHCEKGNKSVDLLDWQSKLGGDETKCH